MKYIYPGKAALPVFLIVMCLSVMGCDDLTENVDDLPDNIVGIWTGTVTNGTDTVGVTLVLSQSSNVVTGTYTVGTATGTVSGTYSEGDATLNLLVGGANAGTFRLDVDENNTATGTFSSATIGVSGTASLTKSS